MSIARDFKNGFDMVQEASQDLKETYRRDSQFMDLKHRGYSIAN
jgi:hypothetical protein